MRRSLVFVLAALFVARALGAAAADPTVDVLRRLGARRRDVWITDVFPAGRDRLKLAADLKILLKPPGLLVVTRNVRSRAATRPRRVNAQSAAADFNRKPGEMLHEVSAQDFAPRR